MTEMLMLPGQLGSLKIDRSAFEFSIFQGEVTEVKKWSETKVSGGGGGTTLYGNVSIDPVVSRVQTVEEFFLRAPSGEERRFQVIDARKFGVRTGQTVSVIESNLRGSSNVWWLHFLNRSTKERHYSDVAAEQMLKEGKVGHISVVFVIVMLFLSPLLGGVTVLIWQDWFYEIFDAHDLTGAFVAVSILLYIAYLVLAGYEAWTRWKNAKAKLRRHAEAVAATLQ